jgi:hypothetical protein
MMTRKFVKLEGGKTKKYTHIICLLGTTESVEEIIIVELEKD